MDFVLEYRCWKEELVKVFKHLSRRKERNALADVWGIRRHRTRLGADKFGPLHKNPRNKSKTRLLGVQGKAALRKANEPIT